jgi:hypothetical protein
MTEYGIIPYDPTDNSVSCYDLFIRLMRERRVRDGLESPRNDDERRQAEQGPVPAQQLDALRGQE